jgi:lipopolysaccharide exporter
MRHWRPIRKPLPPSVAFNQGMNRHIGSWLDRLVRIVHNINWRGEMIGNAGAFAAGAAIRLVSSLILTRLLFPEVYGIIAMISVVAFVVELMSDIGIVAFLVRHDRAREADFLHTVWTVRLVRAAINTVVIIGLAPWIAGWYSTPILEVALQIYALVFLIKAFESISFVVAIRSQNSRAVRFADVWGALLSTIFAIIYSYFSRDHYGMLWGMLVHRAVVVVISYLRSDRIWPHLCWQRNTVRELFGFAKYVGPSSILTIFILQFDKVLILRLFDLKLLGLYGVAGGVIGPISALIYQFNNNVLFPRCTQYLREDPTTACVNFYKGNKKLLFISVLLPSMVGGLASLIVGVLFDSRYSDAGDILQALSVGCLLSAFALPSENLLVASGKPKTVLIGNIIKLMWMLPTSYVGYRVWGFMGFVFAVSLNSLPVVFYYWYQRHAEGLLSIQNEGKLVVLSAVVWFGSWGVASIPL